MKYGGSICPVCGARITYPGSCGCEQSKLKSSTTQSCGNCQRFVEYEEGVKGIYELYNFHIETSDDGLCLEFTMNTPMGSRKGHRKSDVCENWEEK